MFAEWVAERNEGVEERTSWMWRIELWGGVNCNVQQNDKMTSHARITMAKAIRNLESSYRETIP